MERAKCESARKTKWEWLTQSVEVKIQRKKPLKKKKDYKITVLTLSFFPTSNLPFYHPSLTLLSFVLTNHPPPVHGIFCVTHCVGHKSNHSPPSFYLYQHTYMHVLAVYVVYASEEYRWKKKKKRTTGFQSFGFLLIIFLFS